MFNSKKNHSKDWIFVLEESKKNKVQIKILDKTIVHQMGMISLSEHELQVIQAVQPIIKENIDNLVETFYKTILEVPTLKEIIKEHSTVDRLRATLKTHLVEMFDGSINENYLEKRKRVARVHYHIGIEPKW